MTKKFRKSWSAESAFLREQANKLKCVLAGLDDSEEINMVSKVIKDLEDRADNVEPIKREPNA